MKQILRIGRGGSIVVLAILSLVACTERSAPVAFPTTQFDSAVVADIGCDNALVISAGSRLWLARHDGAKKSVQVALALRLQDDNIREAWLACDLRTIAVQVTDPRRYEANVIYLIPIDTPDLRTRFELDFHSNGLTVTKNGVWVRSGSKAYFSPPKPGLSDEETTLLNHFAQLLPEARRKYPEHPNQELPPADFMNMLLASVRLDPKTGAVVERRPFANAQTVQFNEDGSWISTWVEGKAFSYSFPGGEVKPLTHVGFTMPPQSNHLGTLLFSGDAYYFLAVSGARDEPGFAAADVLFRFSESNATWEKQRAFSFVPSAAMFVMDRIALVGRGVFEQYTHADKRWIRSSPLPDKRVPFSIASIGQDRYAVISMIQIERKKDATDYQPRLYLDVINARGLVEFSMTLADDVFTAPQLTSPSMNAVGVNPRLF